MVDYYGAKPATAVQHLGKRGPYTPQHGTPWAVVSQPVRPGSALSLPNGTYYKLRGVRCDIPSDTEVRRLAVGYRSGNDQVTYSDHRFTRNDPSFGEHRDHGPCQTCGTTACVTHVNTLELAEPVAIPSQTPLLRKLLNLVCTTCSKPLYKTGVLSALPDYHIGLYPWEPMHLAPSMASFHLDTFEMRDRIKLKLQEVGTLIETLPPEAQALFAEQTALTRQQVPEIRPLSSFAHIPAPHHYIPYLEQCRAFDASRDSWLAEWHQSALAPEQVRCKKEAMLKKQLNVAYAAPTQKRLTTVSAPPKRTKSEIQGLLSVAMSKYMYYYVLQCAAPLYAVARRCPTNVQAALRGQACRSLGLRQRIDRLQYAGVTRPCDCGDCRRIHGEDRGRHNPVHQDRYANAHQQHQPHFTRDVPSDLAQDQVAVLPVLKQELERSDQVLRRLETIWQHLRQRIDLKVRRAHAEDPKAQTRLHKSSVAFTHQVAIRKILGCSDEAKGDAASIDQHRGFRYRCAQLYELLANKIDKRSLPVWWCSLQLGGCGAAQHHINHIGNRFTSNLKPAYMPRPVIPRAPDVSLLPTDTSPWLVSAADAVRARLPLQDISAIQGYLWFRNKAVVFWVKGQADAVVLQVRPVYISEGQPDRQLLLLLAQLSWKAPLLMTAPCPIPGEFCGACAKLVDPRLVSGPIPEQLCKACVPLVAPRLPSGSIPEQLCKACGPLVDPRLPSGSIPEQLCKACGPLVDPRLPSGPIPEQLCKACGPLVDPRLVFGPSSNTIHILCVRCDTYLAIIRRHHFSVLPIDQTPAVHEPVSTECKAATKSKKRRQRALFPGVLGTALTLAYACSQQETTEVLPHQVLSGQVVPKGSALSLAYVRASAKPHSNAANVYAQLDKLLVWLKKLVALQQHRLTELRALRTVALTPQPVQDLFEREEALQEQKKQDLALLNFWVDLLKVDYGVWWHEQWLAPVVRQMLGEIMARRGWVDAPGIALAGELTTAVPGLAIPWPATIYAGHNTTRANPPKAEVKASQFRVKESLCRLPLGYLTEAGWSKRPNEGHVPLAHLKTILQRVPAVVLGELGFEVERSHPANMIRYVWCYPVNSLWPDLNPDNRLGGERGHTTESKDKITIRFDYVGFNSREAWRRWHTIERFTGNILSAGELMDYEAPSKLVIAYHKSVIDATNHLCATLVPAQPVLYPRIDNLLRPYLKFQQRLNETICAQIRLSSKSGHIRMNGLGKRCNNTFRAVLLCGSTLPHDCVILSAQILFTLRLTVVVTPQNVDYWRGEARRVFAAREQLRPWLTLRERSRLAQNHCLTEQLEQNHLIFYGDVFPSIKSVTNAEGRERQDLVRQEHPFDHLIQPGCRLEVSPREGDHVLVVRQPVLSPQSIRCFRILLPRTQHFDEMPSASLLQGPTDQERGPFQLQSRAHFMGFVRGAYMMFHPNNDKSYGGDHDGDVLSGFATMNAAATVPAKMMLNGTRQIVTAEASEVVNFPYQDSLSGISWAAATSMHFGLRDAVSFADAMRYNTRRRSQLLVDKWKYGIHVDPPEQRLHLHLQNLPEVQVAVVEETALPEADVHLGVEQETDPCQRHRWSTAQLLRLVWPPDFYYANDEVQIRAGVLQPGSQISKTTFGSGTGSLLKVLFAEYGPTWASICLDGVSAFSRLVLSYSSHSVGLEELVLDEEDRVALAKAKTISTESRQRTQEWDDERRLLQATRHLSPEPETKTKTTTTTTTTAPPASRPVMPCMPALQGHASLWPRGALARERRLVRIAELTDMIHGEYCVEAAARNAQVESVLKAWAMSHKQIYTKAQQHLDHNHKPKARLGLGILHMLLSGSKGDIGKLREGLGASGLQLMRGSLVPRTIGGRLSMYSTWHEMIEHAGYVQDSYMRGITMESYAVMLASGRIGVSDSTKNVADTGYTQRRCTSAMHNCYYTAPGLCTTQTARVIYFPGRISDGLHRRPVSFTLWQLLSAPAVVSLIQQAQKDSVHPDRWLHLPTGQRDRPGFHQSELYRLYHQALTTGEVKLDMDMAWPVLGGDVQMLAEHTKASIEAKEPVRVCCGPDCHAGVPSSHHTAAPGTDYFALEARAITAMAQWLHRHDHEQALIQDEPLVAWLSSDSGTPDMCLDVDRTIRTVQQQADMQHHPDPWSSADVRRILLLKERLVGKISLHQEAADAGLVFDVRSGKVQPRPHVVAACKFFSLEQIYVYSQLSMHRLVHSWGLSVAQCERVFDHLMQFWVRETRMSFGTCIGGLGASSFGRKTTQENLKLKAKTSRMRKNTEGVKRFEAIIDMSGQIEDDCYVTGQIRSRFWPQVSQAHFEALFLSPDPRRMFVSVDAIPKLDPDLDAWHNTYGSERFRWWTASRDYWTVHHHTPEVGAYPDCLRIVLDATYCRSFDLATTQRAQDPLLRSDCIATMLRRLTSLLTAHFTFCAWLLFPEQTDQGAPKVQQPSHVVIYIQMLFDATVDEKDDGGSETPVPMSPMTDAGQESPAATLSTPSPTHDLVEILPRATASYPLVPSTTDVAHDTAAAVVPASVAPVAAEPSPPLPVTPERRGQLNGTIPMDTAAPGAGMPPPLPVTPKRRKQRISTKATEMSARYRERMLRHAEGYESRAENMTLLTQSRSRKFVETAHHYASTRECLEFIGGYLTQNSVWYTFVSDVKYDEEHHILQLQISQEGLTIQRMQRIMSTVEFVPETVYCTDLRVMMQMYGIEIGVRAYRIEMAKAVQPLGNLLSRYVDVMARRQSYHGTFSRIHRGQFADFEPSAWSRYTYEENGKIHLRDVPGTDGGGGGLYHSTIHGMEAPIGTNHTPWVLSDTDKVQMLLAQQVQKGRRDHVNQNATVY